MTLVTFASAVLAALQALGPTSTLTGLYANANSAPIRCRGTRRMGQLRRLALIWLAAVALLAGAVITYHGKGEQHGQDLGI